MAARLKRGWRRRAPGFIGSLAATFLILGCVPPSSGQQGGATPPARQTPQASLTPEMAGTAAVLTDALAAAGIRLDTPAVPAQPGEPASVSGAPRALLQADVHDPDGGYVLIYQFADAATAAARGAEFADYLESGPGQVTFPLDTQFALSQVGSTVVFTWWSAELSADRTLAERAFDTIASVGQPIPILK